MASFQRGRIYMAAADAASQVTTKRVKVVYALFIPDAANDQAVVSESSTDDPAIIFSSTGAKEQKFLDFSENPVILEGVYLDSISANGQIILYTTSEGRQ